MISEDRQQLQNKNFEKFLSPYLQEGHKNEVWEIKDVIVQKNQLEATITMSSLFLSETDNNEFHLAIFTSLEFSSQLMIIYLHHWAGLTEKRKEGWMIESSTKSVRAIRDSKNIKVVMNILKIRNWGENIYCLANFTVTDRQGGLFKLKIKGYFA